MSRRRAYDVTLKLRQSSTRRRLAARHFTVDAKSGVAKRSSWLKVVVPL